MKCNVQISDVESSFNLYANAFTITNIRLKALRGLTYLKYQYDKLNAYLRTNPGMKILVVAAINFLPDDDAYDDEPYVTHDVKRRRYEITNSTELQDVINDMAADIETQIELKQFHKSGLRVHSVDKLTVHYDRYIPTKGGSDIELPDWTKAKKACINIKK